MDTEKLRELAETMISDMARVRIGGVRHGNPELTRLWIATVTPELIVELLDLTEEQSSNYMNACRLVAEMHTAAVGPGVEVPIRGVVEDVADVRTELVEARQTIALFCVTPLPEGDPIPPPKPGCFIPVGAAIMGEAQPPTLDAIAAARAGGLHAPDDFKAAR